MGFVLEKISPEDMKKYGFDSKPHLKYMWKSWAIDRERGVFLIKNTDVGGGPGVFYYELHYLSEDKIIIFAAEGHAGHNPDKSVNYPIFNIDSIKMPIALSKKLEMVKLDISESLKKFGYFANPEIKEMPIIKMEDSKIHFIQSN